MPRKARDPLAARRALLALAAAGDGATTWEIAPRASLDMVSCTSALYRLKSAGQVRGVSRGAARLGCLWYLTPEGEQAAAAGTGGAAAGRGARPRR